VITIYPSFSQGELIDKISAVVGDEIILLSDVVKIANIIKIRSSLVTGQELPDKDAMQMALMELIDNKLIEISARDLNVSVDKDEIDSAFSNQISEQGISKEKFLSYLRTQGMDEETYRTFILRNQILRYKVIGLKTGGPRVTIEDAKKFYEEQTMAIKLKAKFKIAHIFIKVPEDADLVETVKFKEKAQKVAELAKKPGADFAELARQYSDDKETAEGGGVLGNFKFGELPQEIDRVILHLEEGEVSDPVYTSGGFHIIKILKKKTPQIKPFEEVKSEIMNDLINNELQRQIEILLKELRRNTYIDVK